jgi:two-component system sensor histidine kinase AtoS
MGFLTGFYPRRLRNQMILMAIMLVSVPTISIGYIVETEGRSAVLSEKEKKLSAVVNLLNDALGDAFSHGSQLPRDARIRALNLELGPITERITRHFLASVQVITKSTGCNHHLRPLCVVPK